MGHFSQTCPAASWNLVAPSSQVTGLFCPFLVPCPQTLRPGPRFPSTGARRSPAPGTSDLFKCPPRIALTLLAGTLPAAQSQPEAKSARATPPSGLTPSDPPSGRARACAARPRGFPLPAPCGGLLWIPGGRAAAAEAAAANGLRDRAEVRAAGRVRGERSSGGKPRASGRRRPAPGAAWGAGPPGLPQPRVGPPWSPPNWRAGPAVRAAPSVHVGSDWRMQRCRRCPLAPAELQPSGGAASPQLRMGRSPGSWVWSAGGTTGEIAISVNGDQRRGASDFCAQLPPWSGRPHS